MARDNYSFRKRKKELAREKKREEKRQRKLARKNIQPKESEATEGSTERSECAQVPDENSGQNSDENTALI